MLQHRKVCLQGERELQSKVSMLTPFFFFLRLGFNLMWLRILNVHVFLLEIQIRLFFELGFAYTSFPFWPRCQSCEFFLRGEMRSCDFFCSFLIINYLCYPYALEQVSGQQINNALLFLSLFSIKKERISENLLFHGTCWSPPAFLLLYFTSVEDLVG